MKRLLAAIILLAFAAPVFGQAPPATLRQHLIPVAPGAGIDITGDNTGSSYNGLIGPYVKSVTRAGDTLTILYQDSAGVEQSIVYTPTGGGGGGGSNDGALALATFSTTTQILTLTLTTGTDITVDLGGLTTAAEVMTLITAAIAGSSTGLTQAEVDARIAPYARATPSGTIGDGQIPVGVTRDTELVSGALQPGDVSAGTNVTITTSADGVTINAAGGGGTADGVVDGGSVSSTTLTLTRTVGADITIPGLPSGGGGSGLTAVASDSTLDGDGTSGDPLGLTDIEVNQLDSIPGLLAETADLSIEVISRTWTDGTDVAAGGFVSHGSGNAITVAEAAALTYFVTRAVTNADGLLNFVVIRVPILLTCGMFVPVSVSAAE